MGKQLFKIYYKIDVVISTHILCKDISNASVSPDVLTRSGHCLATICQEPFLQQSDE